jgi:drug/metabolite transporter (DMT)-like permease
MNAPPLAHRAPHRAELEIVAGSLLISFSAVFVKLAHVGPTAAGVYRNAFGAAALLAIVIARRDALWNGWRRLRWAVLAGVCFAADIYFWHRSIRFVGPGLATILGNFQVFFMAAAGILLFREPATARFLASVPLAVAGLFLLVGPNWGGFDASYRLGVMYGLTTAISYAAYLLSLRGSRREPDRLSATANLACVTTLAALLLTLAAVSGGESLRIPDGRTALILVAYGVLCQALGWVVISRNLHRVAASRAALILLMQPALTFVWDILFFKRATSALEAGGAVLALVSIYLGGVRPGRAAEASPP